MASQHFFIEGRYLGSREIPTNRAVPGLSLRRHDSIVYFCGRCGEIWGRLLHDAATYTQCYNVACRLHGDGKLSFLWNTVGFEENYFEDNWPPEAVKYEFERFLEQTSKGTP